MILPFAYFPRFATLSRQFAQRLPGARGTAHHASFPETLDTGCLVHYAREVDHGAHVEVDFRGQNPAVFKARVHFAHPRFARGWSADGIRNEGWARAAATNRYSPAHAG
jgi:hypothetical protein